MSHPLHYLPPELWEVISRYLKPEDVYSLAEACPFWNELLMERRILPIAWLARSNGDIPTVAFVGGSAGSKNVYVARVSHFEPPQYPYNRFGGGNQESHGVIPGRLHEGEQLAYVSYGGQEFSRPDYEVLVAPPGTVTWVKTVGNNIPENAVEGGADPNGDTYFISRITHQEMLMTGKVHPRYKLGYVAHAGREHEYPKFEILVLTQLGKSFKYIK